MKKRERWKERDGERRGRGPDDTIMDQFMPHKKEKTTTTQHVKETV